MRKKIYFFAFFATFRSVAVAVPSYSVQVVVGPGGNGAWPDALSNGGVVGGRVWNATTNHFDGFVWEDGQTAIVASSPYGDSEVTGINSGGDVVGMTYQDGQVGFSYRDGTLVVYPQMSAWVGGVNDSGLIACQGPGGDAAVLDGEVLRSLGMFGGRSAEALAVNGAGAVLSRALYPLAASSSNMLPVQTHSFVSDGDGSVVELEFTPGGLGANAVAINDAGVVVGGDNGRAALRVDGIRQFLFGPNGGSAGLARSVNAAGLIVGTSVERDGAEVATIWDRDGPADLNDRIAIGSGWF